MSPLIHDDHSDIALDMVPDSVNERMAQPPTPDIGEPEFNTAILHSLDAIRVERSIQTPQQQCHLRRDPQVFPVSAIQALTGREQMRYMRLLRGIARALGVQPFGSTRHLLITCAPGSQKAAFRYPWQYSWS